MLRRHRTPTTGVLSFLSLLSEAALDRQARILHLFVTLPVGGAENLLLSIVRGLDHERFASFVCCIGKRGVMGDRLAAMDIPPVELRFMQKGGWDRRVVPALVDLIRREHIDLVHSHLYHANLYGRLAARKAGVPAVVSIHNTYGKPKLHRQIVNWYLSRHTAAIIVGSEEIKRDVERYDHVSASRIEVIPNAVDLARSGSTLSKLEARARLGLAEHDLVMGSIGKLEEQKGHRYLIEALALLRHRGIVARLLLKSCCWAHETIWVICFVRWMYLSCHPFGRVSPWRCYPRWPQACRWWRRLSAGCPGCFAVMSMVLRFRRGIPLHWRTRLRNVCRTFPQRW